MGDVILCRLTSMRGVETYIAVTLHRIYSSCIDNTNNNKIKKNDVKHN